MNAFNIIINSIPVGVKMLLKSTAGQNSTTLPRNPTKLEIDQICFSSCSLIAIYWNIFIDNLTSTCAEPHFSFCFAYNV